MLGGIREPQKVLIGTLGIIVMLLRIFFVIAGSYKLENYKPNAWKLVSSNVVSNDSWSLYITGNYNLKGFRGTGLATSNNANIFMAFFERVMKSAIYILNFSSI